MPLVYSAPLPTDHTSTVAVLSLPSLSLPQGLCPCCSAQCMAFSHGICNPGSRISFLPLPDSLPQSPYLHWSPGTRSHPVYLPHVLLPIDSLITIPLCPICLSHLTSLDREHCLRPSILLHTPLHQRSPWVSNTSLVNK